MCLGDQPRLQDELQMLKGKLQLSEGQASGHLRAESQAGEQLEMSSAGPRTPTRLV